MVQVRKRAEVPPCGRFSASATLIVGRQQVGFTLVELLLVLSLSAMLSLVAYQAIIDVLQAKQVIDTEIAVQTQRRVTHRTLMQAVQSGAQIIGSERSLQLVYADPEIDFPSGADTVAVVFSDSGFLYAQRDGQDAKSVLMRGLSTVRFRYIKQGVEYASWQAKERPQQLVFEWNAGGETERWWFSVR